MTVNILRQFPFSDAPRDLKIEDETVFIRPYQVIIWISLSLDESLPKNAPMFPSVLDTGHNHNFSIQQRQCVKWAGIQLDLAIPLGNILVNRQEVPLFGVNLWIHRNRPKTDNLLPSPVRIELPQGIAVYPNDTPAPRLPLLGLRGIVTNQLALAIDGLQKTVSLRRVRPATRN